jgi:hypothetical protein
MGSISQGLGNIVSAVGSPLLGGLAILLLTVGWISLFMG